LWEPSAVVAHGDKRFRLTSEKKTCRDGKSDAGVFLEGFLFSLIWKTKSCAEAFLLAKQLSFLPSVILVRNLRIETACELDRLVVEL